MSMNDEMMILSSGFTGQPAGSIKRILGILTHECQQGKLVSISLGVYKASVTKTHHLLLEQEQGLSTQLSSLSESWSSFSPQW